MDNVLLKVLFGVPNVKMRQYPTQEKKTVHIDLSSPKGHVDSFDFVRAKLRESLAFALAMVGDEQPTKYVKAENNFQIDSSVLNKHASEDYKVTIKQACLFRRPWWEIGVHCCFSWVFLLFFREFGSSLFSTDFQYLPIQLGVLVVSLLGLPFFPPIFNLCQFRWDWW